MNLKPRLQAIADMVPCSQTVADIGTDHGYIPLSLIRSGQAQYAIASDISRGSLDKAKQLICLHNLSRCMETRLGNGLSVLSPGEADVIIIAGMGGILIRDIIKRDEEIARSAGTLILQPMNCQGELRSWLLSSGFIITDEELAREGSRFYEIITAKPGEISSEYKKIADYDIGWKLVEKKHPLLNEWLERKIHVLEEIIVVLEKGQSMEAAERLKYYEVKYRQFKEVYNCSVR
ncbi:MAG: tRNA (adenine(22)-N(1))-methyltransferase [Caldicoprobacterales bacterium]|jgi:tRNA (adenine22-N1)-methyltransferase|nr:SAM-dependent methyltransferase [Clostridiales bacterium]